MHVRQFFRKLRDIFSILSITLRRPSANVFKYSKARTKKKNSRRPSGFQQLNPSICFDIEISIEIFDNRSITAFICYFIMTFIVNRHGTSKFKPTKTSRAPEVSIFRQTPSIFFITFIGPSSLSGVINCVCEVCWERISITRRAKLKPVGRSGADRRG